MLQATPSLLDPETCGEDLGQLAARMAEIAPVLCVDCAEYHVKFAMTRCSAPGKSIAVDRPLLIERIQRILADSSRSSEGLLYIVIAGAADTGILATAAHAAAMLGREIKARCRFIVLDRCRSPLTLCAEFAERHGLHVETAQVDLPADAVRFDADIIIAHSFLRFMDRNRQTVLLRKFDSWLKPGGRVIVSQSIRPAGQAHLAAEARRLQHSLAEAQAAVSKGEIAIAEDAARLLRRMHESGRAYLVQPGEIGSAEELRDLMLGAGLREYSIDVMARELASAGNSTFERVRVVAVFGSGREG
jgi:hypothetical protein